MFERFTDGARQLVLSATNVTAAVGDSAIGPEHLLWAAFEAEPGNPAVTALVHAGVTKGTVLPNEPAAMAVATQTPRLPFSAEGKAATNQTVVEARALGVDRVGVEHFVLALLDVSETGRRLVHAGGADPDEIRHRIRSAMS